MPAVPTGTQLTARLARLGPHFAVETYPAAETCPDAETYPAAETYPDVETCPDGSVPVGGWRPFGELVDPAGALRERVAAVRAALASATGQQPGAVERRVAVSMAQLALTARLVCPALGVAALTGGLLELDPVRLRWRPAPDGAVVLAVPDEAAARAAEPKGSQPTPADLAVGLADGVLAGPVRALVEASSRFAVSPQVLWGNVASVVNGAGTLLGTAVPDSGERARRIAAALLDQPPLRGTHHGGAGGFRRRNCCLVYRLAPEPTSAGTTSTGTTSAGTTSAGPGRAVCGDCVLRPPDTTGAEAADTDGWP